MDRLPAERWPTSPAPGSFPDLQTEEGFRVEGLRYPEELDPVEHLQTPSTKSPLENSLSLSGIGRVISARKGTLIRGLSFLP